MTSTGIVFFALALASVSHAADTRLLRAIKTVEAVRQPGKRGPAGELGYYRITPGVWSQHTTAPFARCGLDEKLEEWVAARHLDWIERELVRTGDGPSIFRIALAWNAGLNGSADAPVSAKNYAKRVEALYREMKP